jgi:alpha-1,3-glucan synthase
MSRLQIAMAREIAGWPLYTIIIALGQVLSATSFQITLLAGSQNNPQLYVGQVLSATSSQITLLSGEGSQDNLRLYVLGGIFLAASAIWYLMFRRKPAVWVLSTPWLFFALAFFLIGLPSLTQSFYPAHKILSSMATWCYAVASAAAFLFFGLNFGEEAVSSHLSP